MWQASNAGRPPCLGASCYLYTDYYYSPSSLLCMCPVQWAAWQLISDQETNTPAPRWTTPLSTATNHVTYPSVRTSVDVALLHSRNRRLTYRILILKEETPFQVSSNSSSLYLSPANPFFIKFPILFFLSIRFQFRPGDLVCVYDIFLFHHQRF